MRKRIKAVITKEFAHILRDPTSLAIVFLMPVVMIIIYGYALNFDLERIDAGVIDYSQGELSRQLIDKFANNRYCVLRDLGAEYADPLNAGEDLLRSGKLHQVIVIPRDFAVDLKRSRAVEVGIIMDGSDSNVANLLYQYNQSILMDFMTLPGVSPSTLTQTIASQSGSAPGASQDAQGRAIWGSRGSLPLARREAPRRAAGGKSPIGLNVSTKIYFNPEMKSSYFFIPGLVAILLIMISAMLTSLSIAREKESGSIDLIFISPLKSPEIIIGKTVPYIVVSLLVGCVILVFSRFWFGIPFRGSLLILFLFSLLYVIAGLSLGILISTVAPNQKSAMFAALLGTMLPSIMLSGFIFPLDSLAPVLRGISLLVPATYFLKIIRGVVLKGAEIQHFVFEGAAMVVFSFVLLALAMVKFSRNRKRSR